VSNVQELGLQILGEVEITEVLVTLHHVGQFVVLATTATRQVVGETDSHLSNVDEIHLSDLLFFLVDKVLFDVSQELAGFETESYLVQELAVFGSRRVLTLALRDLTEEVSEVVEHIVK